MKRSRSALIQLLHRRIASVSIINKFFKSKYPQRPFCTAVILAAGNSQRMGADKILIDLAGKPVLAHTIEAFEKSECIDEIVIVTKLAKLQEVADLCYNYGFEKVSKVVCGGRTRSESALAGVSVVSDEAALIGIHDGARPFISSRLIDRVVHDAEVSNASAPAIKPVDTVRIMNAKGAVIETPERDCVALVQTPQVFQAELIKGALTKAVERGLKITDDCSAVEALGFKVSLVAGEEDNIKLTTKRDIYIAEKLLADRSKNE